jgi:hypothetical protein
MGEFYTLSVKAQASTYLSVNFSDTQRTIHFTWNNDTKEMNVRSSDNDELVISLMYSSYNNSLPLNYGVYNWTFIFNRNIVDAESVTWSVKNNSTIIIPSGFVAYKNNFISIDIVNLGGAVSYTRSGNAGKIKGGDSFELYAEETNSYATATTTFRKLQHVHTLVEVYYNLTWNGLTGRYENTGSLDSGNYKFTINYDINNVWINGWRIVLKPVEYNVGHQNFGVDLDYVKFQIDFEQWNGTSWEIKKTGYTTSNCWAYDNENAKVTHYDDRVSSQFYIDMWFNKMNASTVVAARVTPYYYGMYEQGSSWWMGYGKFRPTFGNETHVSFYTNLLDENQNPSNCYDIEEVNFTVGIYKTGIVNRRWKITNYEVLNFKTAEDRMRGIDTPPIVETKVLDMPQGGFLTPLIKAIESIGKNVWSGVFNLIKQIMGGIDTLLVSIGLPPLVHVFYNVLVSIYDVFSILYAEFTNIVLWMVESVSNVINTLFIAIPRYLYFIAMIVESFLTWYNAIIDLFTGGIGDMNDFWNQYNVMEILQLYLIAIFPFMEAARIENSDDPMRTLIEDIKLFVNLITGVFNFLLSLFNVLINILETILGVFIP